MNINNCDNISLSVTVICMLGFASTSPAQAGTPIYNIIDLGTIRNTVINSEFAFLSSASGINNKGQVVGASVTPSDGNGNPIHAFLYSGGPLQDLGVFPVGLTDITGVFYSSGASAINKKGQVVGTDSNNIGMADAFLYSDGQLQNLGTFPGGNYSFASDINNKGQVVGGASISSHNPFTDNDHAFLYSDRSLQDLGTLPGYKYSNAYGINNKGEVVGESHNCIIGGRYCQLPDIGPDQHAFLYSGGTLQNLGTLPDDNASIAYGINDKGQVVGGSALDGNRPRHAFLYSGGMVKDLGSPPGYQYSIAYGINNKGEVVGQSYNSGPNGGSDHAFLYKKSEMSDLNSLIPANSGWVLTVARRINKAGKIVGSGTINGQTHAFLAIPVNPDKVTTQSKDSADGD